MGNGYGLLTPRTQDPMRSYAVGYLNVKPMMPQIPKPARNLVKNNERQRVFAVVREASGVLYEKAHTE